MSLFLKIFLSFWLAQLLIVGTLFGWAWATQQQPSERDMRRLVFRTHAFRAVVSARVYETEGTEGLKTVWRDRSWRRREPNNDRGPGNGPGPGNGSGRDRGGRGWDRDRGRGRDWDGGRERTGPFSAEETEFGDPEPTFFVLEKTNGAESWRALAGPELSSNVQVILDRARKERFGVWMETGGQYWGAYSVEPKSGRTYVLVDQLRRRWFYFGPLNELRRPTSENIARLSVILLMSGIVCFALARHLTAPTSRLRDATRQFAAGNFSTRVGGARRGGDEIAQLSQDFDRMAERIENLVRSERRLLADISHELRSPLARLNVALDLAESEDIADSTNSHLLRIRRESERLNDLIGQLLTLTRLENQLEGGEGNLYLQNVDLAGLTEQVAEDALFEAQQNNRAVTWKLPEGEHHIINADAELLRRALENVVRNALKYTSEGTPVEIELTYNSDLTEAKWCIRDHGPGVPEEALDQLFRPFYRVADARDRKSGGVGLGLAIADRATRLHGGRIFAENIPDGGFRVTIALPMRQAE